MCLAAKETVDHLLLTCQVAYQIWYNVLRWFQRSWVMPRSISSHYEAWRSGWVRKKEESCGSSPFILLSGCCGKKEIKDVSKARSRTWTPFLRVLSSSLHPGFQFFQDSKGLFASLLCVTGQILLIPFYYSLSVMLWVRGWEFLFWVSWVSCSPMSWVVSFSVFVSCTVTLFLIHVNFQKKKYNRKNRESLAQSYRKSDLIIDSVPFESSQLNRVAP